MPIKLAVLVPNVLLTPYIVEHQHHFVYSLHYKKKTNQRMLPCLYLSSTTTSHFKEYVHWKCHDVIFIEQKSLSKSSERIFTDRQHLRNVHYGPWFHLKLKCITFYGVVGVFERAAGLFGTRWSHVNCTRIFMGKKFTSNKWILQVV